MERKGEFKRTNAKQGKENEKKMKTTYTFAIILILM